MKLKPLTFTVMVSAVVLIIAFACIMLNVGSIRNQRFSIAMLRERIMSLEKMQDALAKDVIRLSGGSLPSGISPPKNSLKAWKDAGCP